MPPTIEEVRSILPPPTDDTDAVEVEEVLWGPISPADARAAGAPFASSSILLRPGIDPELRTRVLAEVPLDVIPSGDDTVASFVARLSSSSFLEDSHVQKSGGAVTERIHSVSDSQADTHQIHTHPRTRRPKLP